VPVIFRKKKISNTPAFSGKANYQVRERNFTH